jgi:hypothetical protein
MNTAELLRILFDKEHLGVSRCLSYDLYLFFAEED